MPLNVELLQRVKARILAEPSKVNMDSWIDSCGTTGGIAGHILFEAGIKSWDNVRDVCDQAAAIAGLPIEPALFFFHMAEEKELVDVNNVPYIVLANELTNCQRYTIEYAQVVAKAIDLCIELDIQANLESCQQAVEEQRMKWEYTTADFSNLSSSDRDMELNRMGMEGWELVTVDGNLHYFKRQVPSKLEKRSEFSADAGQHYALGAKRCVRTSINV